MRTTSLPRTVADALVDRGLVNPERADEATDVIGRTLASTAGAPATAGAGAPLAATPVRRRLAEVTAYIGGAFVVGAGVLFVSTTWDTLSTTVQVLLLLGSAVLLFGAGLAAALGRRDDAPTGPVRRRLGSALFTGAAASAAFGVAVQAESWLGRNASEELPVLIGATTGLVVALAGYRIAHSLAGQLGALVAAFTMVPSGLGSLPSDTDSIIPLAVSFVGLGVAWLLVAERGWWHEQEAARVAGWVLMIIGAQTPLTVGDASWLSHLLTGAIAVAGFGGYVIRRAWPYLAAGVVALTLVVPEALNDWFGDSLGAAGILLAAGLTLLGAALAGLRLRQEVHDVEA